MPGIAFFIARSMRDPCGKLIHLRLAKCPGRRYYAQPHLGQQSSR